MKYDKLIGYSAGIITLGICVLFPFADVLNINIPKAIIFGSTIFVVVILFWLFSAGLAEDLNISLPKGIIAFTYYIFGFLGGSLLIVVYFGFVAVVLFVLMNGIVFYAISKRSE